jgi:hypothetical protein
MERTLGIATGRASDRAMQGANASHAASVTERMDDISIVAVLGVAESTHSVRAMRSIASTYPVSSISRRRGLRRKLFC